MSLDLYILQVEQLLTATGFIIINTIILLGSAIDRITPSSNTIYWCRFFLKILNSF